MIVFVYGSLKKGKNYNHLIQDGKFLGKDITLEKYSLYSCSWFPALVEDIKHNKIEGEVYEINATILEELDRYESHPKLFKRKEIQLKNHKKVWCYFYQQPLDKDMKEIKIF